MDRLDILTFWCLLVVLNCIHSTHGGCKTIETTNGGRCFFPFSYNGKEYKSCTTVHNNGVLWCSFNYFFFFGQWGDCKVPCSSSPCKNGGRCENVDNNRGYECKCRKGFSGKNCEKKIIPCRSSPCKNGGTCANVNHIVYKCTCKKGFSGKNCEKKFVGCPKGWTPYLQYCYHATTGYQVWQRGKQECANLGGTLAVIQSAKENAFLNKRFKGNSVWIGAFRCVGKEWCNAKFGGLSYNNWGTGQPNRKVGVSACATLRPDGKWDDQDCSKTYLHSLCQKAAYV